MTTSDNEADLLAPDQVAALLRVSLRTLSRWHALGKGPRRIKIGQRILYRQAALNRWLEQSEQG